MIIKGDRINVKHKIELQKMAGSIAAQIIVAVVTTIKFVVLE